MTARWAAAGLAAAAVAVGFAVAGAAAAPTISGRDREHGARFVVAGRLLTVTLNATSSVRGFAGKRVRAECGSQRRLDAGAVRTARWPAHSHTFRVRFNAGTGPAPVFCSVDTASLSARSYHSEAVLR
jgi:hypothetical protein